MDIFTALETRRSIRHYTGEPIDESKIIEAINMQCMHRLLIIADLGDLF
jgi:nitroreductase